MNKPIIHENAATVADDPPVVKIKEEDVVPLSRCLAWWAIAIVSVSNVVERFKVHVIGRIPVFEFMK